MKVNDYDMAKLRDLAASMKGRKGTISLAKPIVSLLPKVKAVNIPGTQAFKVDCKEFCDAVALLELEKVEAGMDEEIVDEETETEETED
jgi:hypothetical protein